MDNLEKVVGVTFVFIFVVVVFLFWSACTQVNYINEVNSGRISEEQFCDHYKNNSTIPVRCYKYFNVKIVGERQELQGKTTVTVPIYAPN